MARSLVIEIDGMSCNHCVQALTKALTAAGLKVESVAVGRAVVSVEDERGVSAARAAVEKAGFVCRKVEEAKN